MASISPAALAGNSSRTLAEQSRRIMETCDGAAAFRVGGLLGQKLSSRYESGYVIIKKDPGA